MRRVSRARPPRRPGAGRDDDAGLVAVVVALVVTLVLVPVAALALDLGQSYYLGAALQRAADDAAMAGAQELAARQRLGATPAAAMASARTVAITALCHAVHPDGADGGAGSGPWHDACTGGATAWATDGDSDPAVPGRFPDGEIEFYTGQVSPTLRVFAAGQRATDGGTAPVSGIRVVTPPATVRYVLAGAFGERSGRQQASATVELRTVLPARDWNGTSGGNLRLFATTADAAATSGAIGAWCARSGPRRSWLVIYSTESNHPGGVACDPDRSLSVPRGYLVSASPSGHALHAGDAVQLAPQLWTDVARLRDLTGGLLGAGGRLVQSGCPGGNSSSTGGTTGVEAAHLADFLDTSRLSVTSLRGLLGAGGDFPASAEGALRPAILRCGRLAVVPVISAPAPPPYLGLAAGPYTVRSLRLVWLDSELTADDPNPIATATPGGCLQRGFYWQEAEGFQPPCPPYGPLRGVTGYLLDPRLLPATVLGAAAANTTAYLGAAGSGLPASVRLVRDSSDPPAT